MGSKRLKTTQFTLEYFTIADEALFYTAKKK
jgi:hypothetical protein